MRSAPLTPLSRWDRPSGTKLGPLTEVEWPAARPVCQPAERRCGTRQPASHCPTAPKQCAAIDVTPLLLPLQQIVDCNSPTGDGCRDGGYLETGIEYAGR